jgi:hypothetical protein
MNEEPERIVLPKQLQIDMLKFFLRTTIPRMAREKQKQEQDQTLQSEISDKGD